MLLLKLSVYSNCDLVECCKLQIMRKSILALCEWFTSLTRWTRFAVLTLLIVPGSIYHIYIHRGDLVRTTMYRVRHDDIIYRGLSPLGNLNNQKPSWGRYNYLYCMTNDPTFLVGREPMKDMSYRSIYYSFTRDFLY